MTWEKKVQLGVSGILIFYIIFLLYHIVECLRRRDFRIVDKIFWTLLLLVPVLGLIMYRGIGNEFYKKKQKESAVKIAAYNPDKCDGKDTRR
jgi:hypothetical protein